MKIRNSEIVDYIDFLSQYRQKYFKLNGFNKFKYALDKNLRKFDSEQKRLQKRYNTLYNKMLEEYKKELLAEEKDGRKHKTIKSLNPRDAAIKRDQALNKLRQDLITKYSKYKEDVSKEDEEPKYEEKTFEVNGTPAVYSGNFEAYQKEHDASAKKIDDDFKTKHEREFILMDRVEDEFQKTQLGVELEIDVHQLDDPDQFPNDFNMDEITAFEFMIKD